VDFCKRATESGYRIEYVPTVTGRHRGGHSLNTVPWECREQYWYGSLLEYGSKHFRRWEYRAVCAAVVLGSAFRSVLRAFQQRSLKPVAVFAKVSRSAGFGLLSGRSEASPRASGAPELAACGGRVRQVRTISIRK
jgi:GT2 family glycosyltransferase